MKSLWRQVSGGGIALAGMLGLSLLVDRAARPAFFTSGGPLYRVLDEPPKFGPAYWKRACRGLTVRDQQPTGEWLACLGLQTGPRSEYRQLNDLDAWSAPRVPAELIAIDAIGGVRQDNYLRAEILAWRRNAYIDDVLVAAQAASGNWVLSRAWRPLRERDRSWSAAFQVHEPLVGIQEWRHQPSVNDLIRFVRNSHWAATDDPAIERWGVTPSAWLWVAGKAAGAELTQEVDRMKSYVSR